MKVFIEKCGQIVDIVNLEPVHNLDNVHSIKEQLISKYKIIAAKVYKLSDYDYLAEALCIEKGSVYLCAGGLTPVLAQDRGQTPGLDLAAVKCQKPALFYEKICGAVIFRRGEKRKYIIIQNISGNIGFPKGHSEDGENEKETACREVLEEIGIKVSLQPDFRQESRYTVVGNTETIEKTAVYFLAIIDDQPVKIQQEEIPAWWTLEYKDAMKKLKFDNDRNILRQAQYYCI